ncbi:hypothetical protein PFISCL1PPCAC_2823, partial [Pristionchus fissidentatus]
LKLLKSSAKMPRILGERNTNAVEQEKEKIVELQEWKAIHEVNRGEIGNNGSFLEFGEEAVDCLAEDEENSDPIEEKEEGQKKNVPTFPTDSECEDESVESELPARTISQNSLLSQDASNHGEDSYGVNHPEEIESEIESESLDIEFSAPSCSTPLPSSPEVVPALIPLISISINTSRLTVSIGTQALLRLIKWSLIPAAVAVTYLCCPYVQYKVHRFIMDF